MASHLGNGLRCINHCWGEQNSIVNSVRVNDWTAELAIIANDAKQTTLRISQQIISGAPFSYDIS